MAYLLPTDDRQRITFLAKLGSRVLHRLAVPFTRLHLEQTIYRKYVQVLSPPSVTSMNEEDITVADKNDPSNLALVLLEALKDYHIQNSISESPEQDTTKTTIAILTKKDDTIGFQDLLGLVEKNAGEKFSINRINLPGISLDKHTGVENFVVFQRSVYSAEEDYVINNAREKLRQVFMGFLFLLLCFVFVSVIQNAWLQYPSRLWVPPLLLLAAGVFIAFNLFRLEKTGSYLNDWMKKACSGNKAFNCQKVLGSAGSKIFGVISMTDIGMVFFCSLLGFMLVGLSGDHTANYLTIIFWCCVSALPYSLFSIYYQVRVVKKICPLCMMVQAILWLQAGYLLFISADLSLWPLVMQPLMVLALVIAIVASIYFLFTYYHRLQLQHSRLIIAEQNLKNNPVVFNALLQLQPALETPGLPGAIIIGNAKAEDRIVVVLSLTCAACGDKLRELIKLADWFGDAICITIYIKPDPHTPVIVKKLLSYSLKNNYREAINILGSWYNLLNKSTTYEGTVTQWRRLYPAENNDIDAGYVYELYTEWHAENFIPHTPFLVYNDRVLPIEYNHTGTLKNIIEQISEQAHEREEQP